MAAGPGGDTAKHKIVFLGTPSVAAQSLEMLLDACTSTDADWEVSAVVTQPATMQGRGKKKRLMLSPVGALAEERGVPVMSPEKAKDEEFLAALEALAPDLCITAAYGQWLPKRFLDCPRLGTLNIHPSLLPRWRGASPVQRSLEAGDDEVGVSVLWTVAKMDAGPVAVQTSKVLQGDEQTPELLEELFRDGTRELLGLLPKVWAQEVTQGPPRGDGQGVTFQPKNQEDPGGGAIVAADKIFPEEAQVCFATDSAVTVHNKCRAFAGWPGVWSLFDMGNGNGSGNDSGNDSGGGEEGAAAGGEMEDGAAAAAAEKMKLITTRVLPASEASELSFGGDLALAGGDGNAAGDCDMARAVIVDAKAGRMFVACGGGGVLELLEVQPPGKRRMEARSFANGLRGQPLRWVPRQQQRKEQQHTTTQCRHDAVRCQMPS